ncbi:MAG TPA: N-acetylmuramoyl-L-alanine amidase [Candidatus Merdenecus merdavium]|nr:N-acetylmuramoyl-L-alanine amidase [Candidatus Merdenecus merdavium]
MAIKIFIDQGHNPSGFNAGAEGFGYREQDITYIVGAYLFDILNSDSRFDARVSRTYPEEVLGTSNASSLRQRVDMANSWPADYFISIHVNSNPNPDINGAEVYVYNLDSPSSDLAESILQEIVRRTGIKYNGVRENSSLYVLRRSQMPAVLVELGYITNFNDLQLLINDQYQFAYGIYVGLLNYLGLPQL